MTIQHVWFHNIVINQHWKKVQTPNEILLIATAPEKEYSFIAFTNLSKSSPVLQFRNDSIIAIRGGRIFYDTDNIVPEKKIIRKSKVTKKKSKKIQNKKSP